MLQYQKILFNKSFILFLLMPGFLFAAMIAWIAAGPFLLIDRFHLGTIGFGFAQIFIFGSLIVSTRSVRFLMSKFTLHKITLMGTMLSSIGAIYALGSAILFPDQWMNTIIGMMLIAIRSGLLFPICQRLCIESSQEPMGSRIAISSLLIGVAGMSGSALISGFYDDTLLSFSIILCLLCGVSFSLRIFMNKQFKKLAT